MSNVSEMQFFVVSKESMKLLRLGLAHNPDLDFAYFVLVYTLVLFFTLCMAV